MPGTLTFPIDDNLKAIIAHARSAPAITPNFVELLDPECRFDGMDPPLGANLDPKDVDPAKLSRGLWLVKDDGVYLMSPGSPSLPGANGKNNAVAYAVEADPADKDGQQAARDIMGGDDGCDKLDLELFETAVRLEASAIVIKVTENALDVSIRR